MDRPPSCPAGEGCYICKERATALRSATEVNQNEATPLCNESIRDLIVTDEWRERKRWRGEEY